MQRLKPNPLDRAREPDCILSVSGLTVVRNGVRILDGIDWSIGRASGNQGEPGEHWAILGANGSGKTSLLSALTGYLTPTAGEIQLLGERYGAANWPELRKRIGIVSSSIRQQMADHEPALLTVVSGKYAMIDYWGRVSRADREEATGILAQIGCAHLCERPWLVLSQGERQRVLIGRALMAHPRLLILDEPCAGLDPVAREHLLQFIDALSRNPDAPALILVTHHVEEIIPGFSHILLLKAGRVLASGKRRTVLTGKTLSEAFSEPVRLLHRNGRAVLVVGSREASRSAFQPLLPQKG